MLTSTPSILVEAASSSRRPQREWQRARRRAESAATANAPSLLPSSAFLCFEVFPTPSSCRIGPSSLFALAALPSRALDAKASPEMLEQLILGLEHAAPSLVRWCYLAILPSKCAACSSLTLTAPPALVSSVQLSPAEVAAALSGLARLGGYREALQIMRHMWPSAECVAGCRCCRGRHPRSGGVLAMLASGQP